MGSRPATWRRLGIAVTALATAAAMGSCGGDKSPTTAAAKAPPAVPATLPCAAARGVCVYQRRGPIYLCVQRVLVVARRTRPPHVGGQGGMSRPRVQHLADRRSLGEAMRPPVPATR